MECTQWPTVRWPALPRKWFWRGKPVKAARLPSPSRQLLHQPYRRLLPPHHPTLTPIPHPLHRHLAVCSIKMEIMMVSFIFQFLLVCFIFAYSVFYYDQNNINVCWTMFLILFLWFYTVHNENKSLKVTSFFLLISHLAIYKKLDGNWTALHLHGAPKYWQWPPILLCTHSFTHHSDKPAVGVSHHPIKLP